MLVGEGVVTTLCAIDRFQLPGWALAWRPPAQVRRVLIDADRGAVGEGAAARLRRRLLRIGLEARVRLRDPPFGDWNEAAVGAAKGKARGS